MSSAPKEIIPPTPAIKAQIATSLEASTKILKNIHQDLPQLTPAIHGFQQKQDALSAHMLQRLNFPAIKKLVLSDYVSKEEFKAERFRSGVTRAGEEANLQQGRPNLAPLFIEEDSRLDALERKATLTLQSPTATPAEKEAASVAIRKAQEGHDRIRAEIGFQQHIREMGQDGAWAAYDMLDIFAKKYDLGLKIRVINYERDAQGNVKKDENGNAIIANTETHVINEPKSADHPTVFIDNIEGTHYEFNRIELGGQAYTGQALDLSSTTADGNCGWNALVQSAAALEIIRQDLLQKTQRSALDQKPFNPVISRTSASKIQPPPSMQESKLDANNSPSTYTKLHEQFNPPSIIPVPSPSASVSQRQIELLDKEFEKMSDALKNKFDGMRVTHGAYLVKNARRWDIDPASSSFVNNFRKHMQPIYTYQSHLAHAELEKLLAKNGLTAGTIEYQSAFEKGSAGIKWALDLSVPVRPQKPAQLKVEQTVVPSSPKVSQTSVVSVPSPQQKPPSNSPSALKRQKDLAAIEKRLNNREEALEKILQRHEQTVERANARITNLQDRIKKLQVKSVKSLNSANKDLIVLDIKKKMEQVGTLKAQIATKMQDVRLLGGQLQAVKEQKEALQKHKKSLEAKAQPSSSQISAAASIPKVAIPLVSAGSPATPSSSEAVVTSSPRPPAPVPSASANAEDKISVLLNKVDEMLGSHKKNFNALKSHVANVLQAELKTLGNIDPALFKEIFTERMLATQKTYLARATSQLADLLQQTGIERDTPEYAQAYDISMQAIHFALSLSVPDPQVRASQPQPSRPVASPVVPPQPRLPTQVASPPAPTVPGDVDEAQWRRAIAASLRSEKIKSAKQELNKHIGAYDEDVKALRTNLQLSNAELQVIFKDRYADLQKKGAELLAEETRADEELSPFRPR